MGASCYEGGQREENWRGNVRGREEMGGERNPESEVSTALGENIESDTKLMARQTQQMRK